MTENLKISLEALGAELGLPVPNEPEPTFTVDDCLLRIRLLPKGDAVLLGVLGEPEKLAGQRNAETTTLLANCLTLHGARFAKLGVSESLTLDGDELVLWKKFDGHNVSVSEFLRNAESMLNEMDFWKTWLATT